MKTMSSYRRATLYGAIFWRYRKMSRICSYESIRDATRNGCVQMGEFVAWLTHSQRSSVISRINPYKHFSIAPENNFVWTDRRYKVARLQEPYYMDTFHLTQCSQISFLCYHKMLNKNEMMHASAANVIYKWNAPCSRCLYNSYHVSVAITTNLYL